MTSKATPALSVLDLFPVVTGTAPSAALRQSIALAQKVDALGYERYWIAEHHNMPGIASAAPEVLIAHIAQVTKRMRVGAGGIMVPNHTPLRIVEIFRTLAALHPNRIDLGLGRAPGTDPITASALRRSSSEVNEELAELIAFAEGSFPDDHPYASIVAQPSDTALPPIWMLGSTQAGAGIAAQLGVGFAFAGHFSMAEARGAISRYRKTFRPSHHLTEPRVILAVSVICADTSRRAEALALPQRVAVARMGTGRPGCFPTVEEASAHRFTPSELGFVERFTAGTFIGEPAEVRARLTALATDLGADELMVSSVIPDPFERTHSYEQLARVFELPAM